MLELSAPEPQLIRAIEAHIVEAARLRALIERTADASRHGVLQRQLRELEQRIDLLRRRLAA